MQKNRCLMRETGWPRVPQESNLQQLPISSGYIHLLDDKTLKDYLLSSKISPAQAMSFLARPPLRVKKKYSRIQGLLYSKRPARPHGSNEANDKLIGVQGAEISSETCQDLMVWFSRTSPPHKLGSIYRLLCWKGVAQPVVLNTINPIFGNIFFALRGA